MRSNICSSLLQQWQLSLSTHGALAQSKINQHFKHVGETPIELIYQFPLPADAVLQKIEVVINGKRLTGKVLPKERAIKNYESGVEAGKRSLLIEEIEEGFYQLSIANVVCNDEISLEMIVASLLQYVDGRWQYRLPTVLGIKYGNAPEPALPQYSSLFAHYTFQYRLDLGDIRDLQANTNLRQSGEELVWQGETTLDKPLFLSWESGLSPHQWLTCDATENIPACAIGLVYPSTDRAFYSKRAKLQILVDCSGSMNGLPMAQVKSGLQNALENFDASDELNLIRFGSSQETLSPQAHPYTGEFAGRLRHAINDLEANLGGTELHAALEISQICALNSGGGDILLCTDGQLWDENDRLTTLAKELKAQGIRVFTLGIGNSASEPLLRRLAKETGANSYMLNPHTNMAEQLSQIIYQLRSPRLQIDLPQVEWQSLPNAVFRGCTTPFYQTSANPLPLQLSGFVSGQNGDPEAICWQTLRLKGEQADALRKLVAQQKIRSVSPEEAEALALTHQLLSSHSSYVLVQEEVVTDEQVTTLVIPQMIPEGSVHEFHSSSSVCMSDCRGFGMVYESAPDFSRGRIRSNDNIMFSVRREKPVFMCDDEPDWSPTPSNRKSRLLRYLKKGFYNDIDSKDEFVPKLPHWVDPLLEHINRLEMDENWFATVTNLEWLQAHGLPVELICKLGELHLINATTCLTMLMRLETHSRVKVPHFQNFKSVASIIDKEVPHLIKIYQFLGIEK